MNTNKLRYILYFIILVIASTIAIQVYWNYKNYQTNKQQLINDVQVSLDNAVNTYYENLAKQNTIGIVINETNTDVSESNTKLKTVIESLEITNDGFKNIDSLNSKNTEGITITKGFDLHSIKDSVTKFNKKIHHNHFSLDTNKNGAFWFKGNDSLKKSNKNRHENFEFLTTKVIFSITNDSLKLEAVDSLLKIELNRKSLHLNYGLTYNEFNKKAQTYNTFSNKLKGLSTTSKSAFLPERSTLNVYFKNETKVILKRIFGGILISTLLVLAVISCLLYLLKIINKQKQLAEVKNDLISNITHEFKTPIATISVAIESIKDFNVLDDKAKTKKYLELSTTQLCKLNVMVEKLLETATLDSENLNLNKDTIDIVSLISLLVEKHQIQTKNKMLTFKASAEKINTKVDVFHFENALNNIVDNAIKYGGDSISVSINRNNKKTEILISDNGNSLTKLQSTQIFDKFYRVPKGNTHDVKGFGIGLYYTKKIVEKHNGNITVSVNNGTTFKITIPNEQ